MKTINYGNVDLDKFPASKVRQLVKRMESLKSTAKHINKWLMTHKLCKSIL